MKKKLILGLMLALVLSLSMSSTIAADSNVVANDKDQDTIITKWVIDDPGGIGYYEVTDSMHVNWHSIVYADGTMKSQVHYVWSQQVHGDGIWGKGWQYKDSYRESWNDHVGNGIVYHSMNMGKYKDENMSSKYQFIFHYANGEVRVDIVRISP